MRSNFKVTLFCFISFVLTCRVGEKYYYGVGYYAPCWSPDGKRIYYFKNVVKVKRYLKGESYSYKYLKNEWYICSCDTNGENEKEIVFVENYQNPYFCYAWMSFVNESLIVFELYDPYYINSTGMWIINLKNSFKKCLIDTGRTPSGNKNKIAFTLMSRQGIYKGIWIIDIGNNSVLPACFLGYEPAWSPTGKELLCSETWNVSSILKINLESGTFRKLSVEGLHPTWSPDGKKFAYVTYDGIYIADSAGTSAQKLVHIGGECLQWSPGARILVRNLEGIWIVNLKGEARKILENIPW